MIKHGFMLSTITFLILISSGCSPKTDKKEWCQAMVDKPEADWTVAEANEFTDSCRWWGLHVK
jgi:hypothetical protein